MDPLLALIIFGLSVVDDILAVWYYRRCNVQDQILQASLLSGLITAVVAVGVIFYCADPWYLVPNVLGSMVGTPLAIWLDRKFPERKKPRDKTGKFRKDLSEEITRKI